MRYFELESEKSKDKLTVSRAILTTAALIASVLILGIYLFRGSFSMKDFFIRGAAVEYGTGFVKGSSDIKAYLGLDSLTPASVDKVIYVGNTGRQEGIIKGRSSFLGGAWDIHEFKAMGLEGKNYRVLIGCDGGPFGEKLTIGELYSIDPL